MIVTVVYLVGFILAIWPSWKLLTCETPVNDSMDMGFSVSISVMISLFWPIVLVGWLAWRASKALWSRLLGERSEEPSRGR